MTKTAKAELPHPVESLRDDHRRAIRLIRLLLDRLTGLVRPDLDDVRIAQDVMRYMVQFVDGQHHAREDLVIEALGKRDRRKSATIEQSGTAHDSLRSEGRELLALFTGLRGRRDIWLGSLTKRLKHYLAELEAHFAFEETELFRPAERVLTDTDWKRIEAARKQGGDPLFGREIEDQYRNLFEIYVGQVREIGVPSVQGVSVAAAALVDGSLAALEGVRGAHAALRDGARRVVDANVAGAAAFTGSRGLVEGFTNLHTWYWSAFDTALGAMREFGDTVSDTAWSAFEPVGMAMNAQVRSFDGSHRPDATAPSWRVRLMNLGLRATVKRMAGRGTLEDIRKPRGNFDRFIPGPADDVSIETVDIGHATAEIISVDGADNDRTILHCSGGGFVMGPTKAHRLMAGRLARRLGARVMLVHYRLAPEHPFPAGLDDCCAAYDWLLAQGTRPGTIIVSGDSAGGGLALSTVLQMRDRGRPLPGAIVLNSPVTDLSYSGASRRDNSWIDSMLPNDERNQIAEFYLDGVAADDPRASPLFADLSRLPPVLIQVGSIEVLLDDSLRVASKIRAQGGDCECEVWHDMPHDWVLFGMLPESRRALRRIVEFVDRVTGRVPELAG